MSDGRKSNNSVEVGFVEKGGVVSINGTTFQVVNHLPNSVVLNGGVVVPKYVKVRIVQRGVNDVKF